MEIWKDIEGFEGQYQVSSFGRIKSLGWDRGVRNRYRRFRADKIMKLNKNTTGYFIVGLRKDKKYKSFVVHRLVAKAFIPNQENKSTVNHKDGDKLNNIVDNLEWCTPKENSQHAVSNNLYKMGDHSPLSKLSDKQIERIVELSTKMKQKDIAKLMNVSPSYISLVLSGRIRRPGSGITARMCFRERVGWSFRSKMCIDTATGKVYNSITEAANDLGVLWETLKYRIDNAQHLTSIRYYNAI